MILAFLVRLLPILRGGGLYGDFGQYDDGVYFAAATALVHGRLPYRDFLLLHPPGMMYLLAPFAALGNITGTATAFAVARVAFMALGAVNTALVMVAASNWSRRAAIAAGLLYAVMPAAVMVERTTWLIAPQNTLLLIALCVLLQPRAAGITPSLRRSALAGGLAGLAVGIQIWGIVPLAVMLVWLAVQGRHASGGWFPRAAAFSAAAFVTAGIVWLPFLMLAGEPLLRYVVVDQLGRPPLHGPMIVRLRALEGLPLNGSAVARIPGWLLASVLAGIVAVVTWAAWRRPGIRLPALLAGAQLLVLFVLPPYAHYAGWIAPAGSLAIGGTFAALTPTGSRHLLRWPAIALYGTALTLLLLLAGLRGRSIRIDVTGIRADVAGAACVVADEPLLLIETGELTRSLDNGCPILPDPTGAYYDLARGTLATRLQSPAYQQAMASYYLGAGAVLLDRLRSDAFNEATWAAIRSALPHETRRGHVLVFVR